MDENKILVPEIQKDKVGSKTYAIGKLSLKQAISLSRFVAKTVLSSQSKLKELKERTEGTKSNVEDLMGILDLISEKDTHELFSIILNEDDLQYLEDNLNLEKSTEILAILCEQNDFEPVKKNVQRIIKAVTKK